jgi:hypothetical protein
MATWSHGVAVSSTAGAATYTTGSFTPPWGCLLVLVAVVTVTVDAGAASDSLGGTWTKITSTTKTAADTLYCFVRDQLCSGASMTCTMDVTGDNGTGAVVFVACLTGMTRTGSTAVRQSQVQANQGAGGTPAPAFVSACLTGNPTLAFMANASNPAATTPPSGWAEPTGGDTGFDNPTGGGEYGFRDSGFTGTTVTWGSTSATAFGAIIIELDASPSLFPELTIGPYVTV